MDDMVATIGLGPRRPSVPIEAVVVPGETT
jgi:hypothetical protein